MNKRIAKKVSRQWTAFDLEERKRRPWYTRYQLGQSLLYGEGRLFRPLNNKFRKLPWKYSFKKRRAAGERKP